MILVDTNVIIAYARGRQEGRILYQRVVRSLHRWISAVTLYELTCSGLVAGTPRFSEELLEPFQVASFGTQAAHKSAFVNRILRRRGEVIEIRDLFIAGTALALGARLATLNVKHFQRVPGIKLVDAN